jgi:transposase-like protein
LSLLDFSFHQKTKATDMNSSTYSEAFKQNALLKVYERKGRTIATVAKDLNLNTSTLKGWMQHTKRQHPISSIPVAKRPD